MTKERKHINQTSSSLVDGGGNGSRGQTAAEVTANRGQQNNTNKNNTSNLGSSSSKVTLNSTGFGQVGGVGNDRLVETDKGVVSGDTTTNAGLVNDKLTGRYDLDSLGDKSIFQKETDTNNTELVVRNPEVKPQPHVFAETESEDGGTVINDYKSAYDEYKKQLDINKVNAQNDIAKANRVAQQYLNNYLKQYGIEGSGAGASAMAGIGSNYASQMANVNQAHQSDLADYRREYNNNLLSDEALADLRGMNNEQAEAYINNLSKDSGIDSSTIDQLKSKNLGYIKEREDEFKASRSEYLDAFKDVIESGEAGANENVYREIYQEVLNAKTQDDLDKVLDKVEAIEHTDNTELPVSTNVDGSINVNSATVADFGHVGIGSSKDGKQDAFIQSIISAGKNEKIKDGTYIDMNFGAGTDVYLYQNGTFTKVEESINKKDLKAKGLYINKTNAKDYGINYKKDATDSKAIKVNSSIDEVSKAVASGKYPKGTILSVGGKNYKVTTLNGELRLLEINE